MTDAVSALSISFADWHPANVERVRKALGLSLRNESIRAAYRQRGDEDPGACVERLAREHHVSESAIKAVLWPS